MSKLDKKTQGKVNTIISEIEEFMFEFGMTLTDKSSMLSYFSAVICQLDTDIAIEVMEHFGEEGKHQATAIKVNYGY
tara:strand:- start:37156 stop:37386 length:231 start_codon:yes stop_codon:yes gene_type:complete